MSVGAAGHRIAVVGSGPAGIYCVQHLLKDPGVASVDVLEKLPAPYGLVRYGVAPDHVRTRGVVRTLAKVLADPRVRLLANVAVGRDVTREELLERYDAVVYATGAAADRPLEVPGAGLVGCHGAAELVAWYNGHPDHEEQLPDLSGEAAVVIGAGNVALDVARMLARPATDLRESDVPDRVLDVLSRSAVRDVHLLARRGPAEVRFTPLELRELGAIAEVVVDAPGHDWESVPEGASRDVATNLDIMRGWAAGSSAVGSPRRVHLHFWTSPVSLLGGPAVEAVRVRQELASGSRTSDLPAQLVVSAIGYLPAPVAGLPYDAARGVVPHVGGRVLVSDDRLADSEFVCGWLKRGPSGVIGTNRADAGETVRTVLAHLADVPPRVPAAPGLAELLAGRGVEPVDFDGWTRVEAAEVRHGERRSSPTAKFDSWVHMLDAARAR